MSKIDAIYTKAQAALENGRKAVLLLSDPRHQDALLSSLSEDAASVERLCKGPTAAFAQESVVMNYAERVLRVARRQAQRNNIDLGDLA